MESVTEGAKRWREGVKGEVSHWIRLWYYVMMDWGQRKGRERGRNLKGGEMESILFSWQIDVIHLNHVTPPAHSLSDQHHTQGQLELQCEPPPTPRSPFLTFFSFSASNKRRCMSSILPRKWTNKTTACSYVYRGLSSPLKKYIPGTNTPSERWARRLLPRSFSLELLLYCVRWSDFPSSLVWFLFRVPQPILQPRFTWKRKITWPPLQHTTSISNGNNNNNNNSTA